MSDDTPKDTPAEGEAPPSEASVSEAQQAVEDVFAAASAEMQAEQAGTSEPHPVRSGEPPVQHKERLMGLKLHVAVEVGRARMCISDLLQLSQGSVLELDKIAGESLDFLVNGRTMAKGEAVIVNEHLGIRILEISSQKDRVNSLGKK